MEGKSVGVTVMQEFERPNEKGYSGFLDYMDRNDAKGSEPENVLGYANYNDYMEKSIMTSGLFSNHKDSLTVKEKSELKGLFVEAQNNESLMWKTVISFDNTWLEENGVYMGDTKTLDERKIKEVSRKGIKKMLANEKLEHAVWSASIHYDTDNIHVHMAAVEVYPQREKKLYKQYLYERNEKSRIIKKTLLLGARGEPIHKEEFIGRFKGKSIEYCKSTVVNEIVQSKDINKKINDIIRNKIVKKKIEQRMIADPDMRTKFLKLYESLPDIPKNLMNYNNNVMRELQPMIDELSKIYIAKYHKEDYSELLQTLKKQNNSYGEAYGCNSRDRSYERSKQKELYERLGNAILKEVRNYDSIMREKDVLNLAHKENEVKTNIISTDEIDYQNRDNFESVELSDFPGIDAELQDWHVEDTRSDEENSENTKKYKFWFRQNKKAKQYLQPTKGEKINYNKAMQTLEFAHLLGNPLATYTLGEVFLFGKGQKIDLNKAELYFSESLNIFKQDERESTTELANDSSFDLKSYLSYRIGKQNHLGYGIAREVNEAIKWFVASGSSYANFSLGNIYYNGDEVEKDYQKAFDFFKDTTEMPFADLKIAKMYSDGKGVQQSKENAATYYKKAFDEFMKMEEKQPDDKMEYQIGVMLYNGWGCKKNEPEAIEYFKLSAKGKNAYAQYKLGMIYIEMGDRKNVEKAYVWLHELADEGKHVMAQYALGKNYTDEKSEKFDMDKGLRYLKKAAKQNNQYAQYKLGKIYISPEYEFFDFDKGVLYLEGAADQNNEYALYTLGKIYMEKDNIKFDEAKGIKYMEKAAELNNEFAQYKLGKLYLDQRKELFDIQKGLRYMEAAALHQNSFAQYQLGKLYLDCESEVYNRKKGLDYYEKSAAQDNTSAQYQLGKIYTSTENKEYDLFRGIENLEDAMDSGNNYAKYYLSKLYLDRQSMAYNPKRGMEYLFDLGNDGFEYAQVKIGFEYLKGENVERNIEEASKWFTKAKNQGNELATDVLENLGGDVGNRKGMNELDKALNSLRRSMNEEYYNTLKNIREYERTLDQKERETLEL